MNWIMALVIGLCAGALAAWLISRAIFEKRMRRVVDELTELRARMEKLDKVRSTFVANVTHELKTPLTSIKGYIELLKTGKRDEETLTGFYDIIDIETERLHTLIDDILQLSEIENSQDDPRQQMCDLHELGEEIFNCFLPQAKKMGLELSVRIPEDLSVRGNKYRLKQLLTNLVDNAIKYNAEHGKVLLRAWHEQGNTVLCVSDTGIGIPEEHVPHVFERFYRVDKSRSRTLGGTGLGLSIVKHVVQLHSGTIQIESKQDKGTMFTIRLPD